MRRSWPLLVVVTLALAGCMLGPNYKRPEIDAPKVSAMANDLGETVLSVVRGSGYVRRTASGMGAPAMSRIERKMSTCCTGPETRRWGAPPGGRTTSGTCKSW